jgi:hypothetical protein
MPLPVFDKQEDVPEAFRPEYEERDGKWHPKVPDVQKLNSALESERTRAANEEKARKAAEKERDDLKRAQTARDKGISEEELQKIRDEEAKARKPLEDENAALKAENDKLKRLDRVRAIALEKGVMTDRIEDAMTLLDPRTELTKEGTIAVRDKNGAVTVEKIEDFLEKTFKAEKPWLYRGSESSGSGAEGSNGGAGQGSYDPVKAGKDAAAAQKANTGEKSLAFR